MSQVVSCQTQKKNAHRWISGIPTSSVLVVRLCPHALPCMLSLSGVVRGGWSEPLSDEREPSGVCRTRSSARLHKKHGRTRPFLLPLCFLKVYVARHHLQKRNKANRKNVQRSKLRVSHISLQLRHLLNSSHGTINSPPPAVSSDIASSEPTFSEALKDRFVTFDSGTLYCWAN